MNKDRVSKSFSLKGLLIFIIPSVIVLAYVFYIKQDIKSSDKWLSVSELKEVSNLESFDNNYMYCTSYNNIQNEKLWTMIFTMFLICVIVILIIVFVGLLGKYDREKNKYSIESNKKNKTDEIISKFVNDDVEIKTERLLGDEFKNALYNVFCKLQIACMNFDYKTLKKLLTDELYNNYCASLEVLKSKSRRNIFSDFEFVGAKFVDIEETDKKTSIKVHLKVKFYGYIEDTNNHEIIKGSKNKKIINTYMLNLDKYKNINNDKCHCCGASIEKNIDVCEYCKTKVITKSSNWIIADKEKINEN